MLRFINFSLKAGIVIIIVLILLSFSSLWYFSSGLPDYKKLSNYQPPVSSRIYSDDGTLIAEYAIEKRLFIPYSSIPKKIIHSFLSAEDKNFFNHPGIDAKGIARAIIKNIENIFKDKRLEGASTITQQVAKNFLLTNEVSIKRKIKEAILAFRIEKAYSKERILELYLNQIYLGEGTYGIAAASLEYFDKSVKELNYEESALLAALPKAPSKYNPFRYKKEAKLRRDLVLINLKDNGFINAKELKELKKKEIILKKRKIEIVDEANSYSEEIRRIIKENYGFKKLYEEGLAIKSPVNVNYQMHAQKALREGIEAYDKRQGWRGSITNKFNDNKWKDKIERFKIDANLNWELAELIKIENESLSFNILKSDKKIKITKNSLSWVTKKDIRDIFQIGDINFIKKNDKNIYEIKQYPKVNGAIVALDPYTGRVKALVGGFNYRSSEFNRATQAKRQPGSAFKPFVYAAALENNFSPNSIVLDAPFVADQGVGLKTWKPENYGKKFYGPSTLRKGIEFSRNLMTVRISESVGLNKILDLSKKLEIYEDIPELLSVSLGSSETTLINLTSAYSTFVNGGNKVSPVLIDRIQDRRGKTIFNSEKRGCLNCDRFTGNKTDLPEIQTFENRVISEETAYQITSILEGVITRGTGKKLRDLNVPLAGKTGTTNNNYDAWFIGFTSNLVIGVYIGYDNPKTLGKYETGSKAALPIFKNFIKNALYKDDFKEFNIPEGIYFTPINYNTGKEEDFGNNKAIVEAFKLKDINNNKNKNSNTSNNYDKLVKFRQFY